MTAADSASLESFVAYRERLLGTPYPMGEVHAHARLPDGRFTGMVPRKEREVAQRLAGNDFSRIAAPALAIYTQYHSAEQFYAGFASFDAESQALARQAFAVWNGWASGVRSRFRHQVQRPTVVLLPGAHHYLFISHPDQVERTMRDFLARAARP